jgi:phosphatidylserine synthase
MQGLYDRIVLVFFVACGVSRLARYNVTAEKLSGGTGKVAYFEGTPIPTSMLLVAVLWARRLRAPSVTRSGAASGGWRASGCTRWC